MLPTKQCTKCKKIKQLSEFHTNKALHDGLASRCKSCIKLSMQSYYKKNRDELINKKKEYSIQNRDIIALRQREYRRNNLETISNNLKKYYDKHKEIFKEKSKIYRANNKKALSKSKSEYYHKNKDKIRAKHKEYIKTDIGYASIRNASNKRRAKYKEGDVSTYEIAKLLHDAKVCRYCDMEFSERVKKNVDHIMPLARGGKHTFSNLQIICESCNCTKNAKDPLVFANTNGMLF